MRVVLLSLSVVMLLGAACGGDDSPGSDGGPRVDMGASGGDGAPPPTPPPPPPAGDGGSSEGSITPPPPPPPPGTCNPGLDGMPCTMDDSCNWRTTCTEGRCDCPFGMWLCSSIDTCGMGGCPDPREARCGEATCTAGAEGCLCSCGGPNFSPCSCSGGTWQCMECR